METKNEIKKIVGIQKKFGENLIKKCFTRDVRLQWKLNCDCFLAPHALCNVLARSNAADRVNEWIWNYNTLCVCVCVRTVRCRRRNCHIPIPNTHTHWRTASTVRQHYSDEWRLLCQRNDCRQLQRRWLQLLNIFLLIFFFRLCRRNVNGGAHNCQTDK